MTTRAEQVVDTLVELADTLVADFDVVELMSLLTDRCVDVLDVDAAGIMLAGPQGDLRVMASSSDAMRLLELFEIQSQEGPCLDCFRSGGAVSREDLSQAGGAWPRRGRTTPAVDGHGGSGREPVLFRRSGDECLRIRGVGSLAGGPRPFWDSPGRAPGFRRCGQ